MALLPISRLQDKQPKQVFHRQSICIEQCQIVAHLIFPVGRHHRLVAWSASTCGIVTSHLCVSKTKHGQVAVTQGCSTQEAKEGSALNRSI